MTTEAPREYTREEVRERFLRHVKSIAVYWANESRTPDVLDKIEGAFHSLLATIDGCSPGIPAFALVPLVDEEDNEHRRENGENWYPLQDQTLLNCDIGGGLHESWHDVKL